MKHFKLMKGVLACLLSLALVFSCFGSVGLQAAEGDAAAADTSTTVTNPTAVNDATFKWETESIEHSTAAYVYVLKAKTGNTIKKGAKSVQLAKATGATVFSATMTDLGVKVGKKDVYLYICDKEFEDDGKNISANFEIKAPAAKKITATIDYAKADGTELNVISAKAVDTAKKEIKNPEIWWSTEADGTYFQVNDATQSATRTYGDTAKTPAPNGFDGKTLKELLPSGGIIYIKMAGVDGASGTAQFGSKAIKVKVAKEAGAPKIKVDAKKDTLAIKNGFDFGYAEKVGEEYVVRKWFTVLPNLKTATVKTSAESLVPTEYFTPLNKKDSNAGKAVSVSGSETEKTYSFTAYKFKAVSIDMILDTFKDNTNYENGDCIIAVRKSATEKKPASAATYLELSGQTLNPVVYTQDNVKGQYLVATATEFEKKGFSIGTIVPYPGSVSGEGVSDHHIATIGYDDTFEVGKAGSGEKVVDADTNGTAFEFAIIASKDLNAAEEKAVDWSTIKWKKIDSKTKITSKLKTKYNLLDGTKVTAQLGTESGIASGSGEVNEPIYKKYSAVKTFIVIRRTGDSKSAVRASACIYLYVAKEGKNYNLYSTVDNGDVAYKYNVKFLKYQKGTDGTYSWAETSDVEDISVWLAPTDTKYLALPSDASYTLFETGSASGATTTVIDAGSGAVTSVSGGTNNGKYEITGTSGDYTKYLAVREKANVKIVAEVSISGETTKKEETLITITNGKSSISGDTTVYYVGSQLSISGVNVPEISSVSGYSTPAVGTSATSGVTISGSGDITATINTAEVTALKVSYVRTANTYDFSYSSASGMEIAVTGATSGSGGATYGKDISFTVTASSGDKVPVVSYTIGGVSQQQVKLNDGKYTIHGSKVLGAIVVTFTEVDKS